MGDFAFQAVTVYKDTATLDAESWKLVQCIDKDTPECKAAVDRYLGIQSGTYAYHTGTERWEWSLSGDSHTTTETNVKITTYHNDDADDLNGDGTPDELVISHSQRDATNAVMIAMTFSSPTKLGERAVLLFLDKPPEILELPIPVRALNPHLDRHFIRVDPEGTLTAEMVARAQQFVEQHASGVRGAEKVCVSDLNGDKIADIEIETGRTVDGQHEFIQFLSQLPAAALAPHRKALEIITGATDDATLLAKLGALETLATQTGRTLEATIHAKLVKALVATYRVDLELITGSQDEAVLRAKTEQLIILADQTDREIIDVIRAKAEKARQK